MRSSVVVSSAGVNPLKRARLSTMVLFSMTSVDTRTAETTRSGVLSSKMTCRR